MKNLAPFYLQFRGHVVRKPLNNSRTENRSSALFLCHRTASPWVATLYLLV